MAFRRESMSGDSVLRKSEYRKESQKRRKWLSDDYWPTPRRNFLPAIKRNQKSNEKTNNTKRRRSSDLFSNNTNMGISPGANRWLNKFVLNLRRRSLERKERMQEEMLNNEVEHKIAKNNEIRSFIEPFKTGKTAFTAPKNDTKATHSTSKAVTSTHKAMSTATTTTSFRAMKKPNLVALASNNNGVQHNWESLRTRLLKAKISDALTTTKFSVCGKTYSSLRCLGEGGYSTVYEVFDDEDKSLLALKVVRMESIGSEALRQDLLNEIKFLELFRDCNHVIQMIGHEYVDQTLYLLLERGELDLGTVVRSLRERAQLTPTKIRFYWEQMLECVREVHSRHVVHADLKPANFLLVQGQLKVIDFGLAGRVEKGCDSVSRNFVGGTKDYMSPESVACYVIEDGAINFSEMRRRPECKARVGFASDIWALGVILYQLVYEGVAPFASVPGGKLGKLKALMDRELQVDLDPLNDISLMDTLRSCLNKDPALRPDAETLLRHEFLNP